jgi:hypothetical protein
MRFILLLFILALAHVSCDHGIAFKKRTLSAAESSLPSSPESRNKFIEGLTARPNLQLAPPDVGIVHLEKDEFFVYSTKTSVYKIRTIPGSTTASLIKTTGGREEARVEWSIDGGTRVLDDDGYVMYEDCMDGDCAQQAFYSPTLQLLNIHKPYPSGTMFSRYGYSDKLVCIYTQLEGDSQPFKVSLLNHKGDLLLEKEFPDEHYRGITDVQFAGNKILFMLEDLASAKTRIIALDTQLNLLWKKKLSRRGRIKTSKDGNSIVVFKPYSLILLNPENGQALWELRSTQAGLPKAGLALWRVEFVLKDQFLAVVAGDLKNPEDPDNFLTVIDIQKRQKVYTDRLEPFTYLDPYIIDNDTRFMVIVHSKINEYTK